MLFVVQWSGPPAVRTAAVERYKRLKASARSNGIKVHARWHSIAEPGGYAIIEADDASALAVWVIQWNDLFNFTLTPVTTADEHDAALGLV